MTSRAVAGGRVRLSEPLWGMARRKRPWAEGMPSRAPMLMAPADSPKTVTSPGSPPKASMLSRTQVRAATWSSSPRLPDEA